MGSRDLVLLFAFEPFSGVAHLAAELDGGVRLDAGFADSDEGQLAIRG